MKGGGKLLIFFGLFWSGITLLFDGIILTSATRQVLASRFATTQGTVLSSEVTHNSDGDGTTHGVRITYRYEVEGREYSGDRFRYDKSTSSDSAWARQAVKEHRVGSAVTVYYDPQNPAEAVLRVGLAGSDLFMAMFLTPFNVVMLGFWWWGCVRLRRRLRKPVAGGVWLRTELRGTRARLTEFSPLAMAVVIVALLAFLSTFVVAIGFGGFHPSLQVMKIVWTIILCGGALSAVWHWQRILHGKYDLILDELNGTLQLPPTCGRKANKIIPLTEIQSVFVDTIEKCDSEGDKSSSYVPTLRLAAKEGPTEKLAEWHDGDKARDFVAWLREKLPVRQGFGGSYPPGGEN